MRKSKSIIAIILTLAMIICASVPVFAEQTVDAAAGGTVIPIGETTYDFTKLTTKTLAAGTEGFEGFSGSVTQLSKSGEEYVKFSKTEGELDFVVEGKWSATFSGGTKGTKGLLITAPDGKLYGNKGGDTGLVLSDMPAGTYKITAVRTACEADDGTGKTLSLTANNGYLTTAVFTVESNEPPAAVTNLTAKAGNGSVTLSWDAAVGATSYNVAISGGGSETVETTDDNSFIATGLTNDIEYTFAVTAVNSLGDSEPVTVTATPKEPTDPPGEFTLSGESSDKAAVLIWTASDYASSYDVYKNGEVVATDLSATSYTATGLENGTEYTFKVEAKNKNGSTYSNEVKVTPVEPPPSEITITKQIGELETAIVEWTNSAAVDKYNVYVKPVGGTYTKIDDELVRYYGSYYRADAVGLAAGKYIVKIAAVVGGEETDYAETSDLEVTAYIREGFAFDPTSDNYDSTGVGAYNMDGTLKDGAQVLYIDNDNKDTVKFTVMVKDKPNEGVGLANILALREKNGAETTPLAIRMIGQVEAPDGINSDRYIQIKACENITFEGIGNDATTYHWSFLLREAVNVEVRNVAVMEFYDDGISLDTKNYNCWIHNCDIFYGQDRGTDQKKGDGSLDVKSGSDYCTFSYNHFWDSGKCSLCGMKSDSYMGYHMTYYGNWFDHSDSRMPRIRGDQVHVYNNYYDGNSKYGVGACTGSSAFVENNVFRNVKYPILTSMQGSDVAGDNEGTFSSEDGGVVKSYNNVYIEGSQSHSVVTYQENQTEYDAYEATSRDEQVPETVTAKQGDGTYSNFDTASDMYQYNALPTDQVVTAVETWAGRVEGGDFYHEFNDEVDDQNSERDTVLGDQLQTYTTTLVKDYLTSGTYPSTDGEMPTPKPTDSPIVVPTSGPAEYTATLNVTGGKGELQAVTTEASEAETELAEVTGENDKTWNFAYYEGSPWYDNAETGKTFAYSSSTESFNVDDLTIGFAKASSGKSILIKDNVLNMGSTSSCYVSYTPTVAGKIAFTVKSTGGAVKNSEDSTLRTVNLTIGSKSYGDLTYTVAADEAAGTEEVLETSYEYDIGANEKFYLKGGTNGFALTALSFTETEASEEPAPSTYKFEADTVVKYTGTPDTAGDVPTITVTASDGSNIAVDNDTFVMPAKSVTVDVVYSSDTPAPVWPCATITSASLSDDGRLSVQYTLGEGVTVPKLYAAIYADNAEQKLATYKEFTLSGSGDETFDFTVPTNGTLKLFIWDGLDSMKPLSLAYSAKISAPAANVTAAETYGEYKFDVSIMREVQKGVSGDESFMLSPISIKTAFAMAANGAEGDTKSEILNALGIEDLDTYNADIKKFMARLEANREYNESMSGSENHGDKLVLNMSNSIWLNKDYYPDTNDDFSDEFKTVTADYYSAEANTVGNDDAVDIINSWISDKTNGKINNMIDNSEFWNCLVNAIYMDAAWSNQFKESSTKEQEFTTKTGNTKTVDMMHRKAYMSYYSDDELDVVRLPYKGNASMYVVLTYGNEASNVLKHLNEFTIEYVNLSLPKFKTEYSEEDLISVMKNLGVQKAFSSNEAEFGKMVENVPEPLYIEQAMHKSYISVDENGTEAAAATTIAGGSGGTASEPTPIYFTADRPFSYFILDDSTGYVLFMGAYNGD